MLCAAMELAVHPVDSALVLFTARQIVLRRFSHQYVLFAVFAESLKFFALGAPLLPGLRIFSLDPAAIRFLLA